MPEVLVDSVKLPLSLVIPTLTMKRSFKYGKTKIHNFLDNTRVMVEVFRVANSDSTYKLVWKLANNERRIVLSDSRQFPEDAAGLLYMFNDRLTCKRTSSQ